MSANDANLKGVSKGQDASEVNEAPQTSIEQGVNSDIKFNSADIGKKKRTEYFVRIEGDEEKKKAAEKQAAAERKAAEKEAAIAKKAADAAKKEADRIAKEDAAFLKREERKNARRVRCGRLRETLFGGKRKFLTIGVLLLVIAGIVGGVIVYRKIELAKREGEMSKLEEKAFMDKNETYRDFMSSWNEAETQEEKDQIMIEAYEYYESIDYRLINKDTAIVSLIDYCDVMAHMGGTLDSCVNKMIENKSIADTDERKKVLFGELEMRCLDVGNNECIRELEGDE